MNKTFSLLLLAGAATVVTTAPVWAVDEDEAAGRIERSFPDVRPVEDRAEMKPHVGIMGGYQDMDGVDGNASVGVDVGFQPIVPISFAVQFMHSKSDVQLGPIQEDFDTTNLLGKFAYNFGGDIPIVKNTYIGAKTGVTWYDTLGDSTAHYSLGPVIGMDFPLGTQKFTLGPEASYLAVFGDNSPDQLNAAGALKYWF